MKAMKATSWALALLLASCASYDPAVNYRVRLAPFSSEGREPKLVAEDFGVPEVFVPAGLPTLTDGSTAGTVEVLLAWMGSQVVFDGSSVPPFPLTAPRLWSAARSGRPLNCLAASTLFASLAQGSGLSARVLWLYPRDLSDENHVIVLIWDPEGSRWLAADPSYQTLFYDEKGRALGPEELRSSVASGRVVTLSPGASWNGNSVEPNYFHYLSKNLYRWAVPGSRGEKIQLTPPSYFGFGPPGGWTVVHDPQAFLLAPTSPYRPATARP